MTPSLRKVQNESTLFLVDMWNKGETTDTIASELTMAAAPTCPNNEVRKRNFPNILYTMLQNIEMEGRFDIVSWSPHGRTFHIHKINEFEEQVLPRYDSKSHVSILLDYFSRLTIGSFVASFIHP